MDSSFALWHLGVGFVIAAAAFGFSLKAASRYNHPGVTLLCASLGIEALGNLLSLFLILLDPGKSSFLLWSSGVLRYVGLGLLLGGWVTLAVSKKSIVVREIDDLGATPPMISGAGLLRWGIAAVLVLSLLAAAWTFLSIFAAGMKTVPRFTAEEARHPFARDSSCLDRALRARSPVGGRESFRGAGNRLLGYQSRLRLAHGGQLLVALDFEKRPTRLILACHACPEADTTSVY